MSFSADQYDNIQPSESTSQVGYSQDASSIASSSRPIFPSIRSPFLPEHYLLIENDSITLTRASVLMQTPQNTENEDKNRTNSSGTDKKKKEVSHTF